MTIAQSNRQMLTALKTVSQLASIIVTLVGGAVLVGWLFDIPILTSFFPGWVAMKAKTALGFVFSGLALYLLNSRGNRPRRVIQVLAVAIAFLGLLTISQYILDRNWVIEQSRAIATSELARIPLPVALNFILVSVALFVSVLRHVPYRLVQLLTLVAAFFSLQILMSFSYGNQSEVYAVTPIFSLTFFTGIAIHTAVTFVILSLGILLAAPAEGWMRLVVSNTVGGITARILLPAAIAIHFGLGWLQVLGERIGLFDEAFGLSLHVTGNIIAFLGLTWYCAERLYRLDSQRQQTQAALTDAYNQLETRVAQRTAELSQTNQALKREIAERMQAEQSLRQSEENFRRAILDAPLPMALHAEDGEILQVNHTWTEITGYHPAEISTIADWTEKAYGKRQEQVQTDIAGLYHLNRRIYEGQYVIRTSTGETRIWDFYSAPLGKLPDGRRLAISTAIDITERQQAENQLREQAQLLDLAYEAIFVRDNHNTIRFWNRSAEQLYGWTSAEVLGNSPHTLLQTEFPDPDLDFQATLLQQGHWQGELRHTRRDGNQIIVESRQVLMRDAQGRVKGILEVNRDITERKQIEQERQRLASIVENIPNFIAIANLDGQLIYVNSAGRAMVGLEPTASLTQLQVTDFHPPEYENFLLHQVLPTILEQGYWQGESLLRDFQTEELIPVHQLSFINRDRQTGEPLSIATVIRDIREIKRVDAERLRLLQQLEIERSRLEQVLQQMPLGVSISEAPAGRLLFHNQEAVRLLRHPMLLLDTYQDYIQYGAIHADGQPYHPEEYPITRALLNGETIKGEEMIYRRGDGTTTFFSVTAAPIMDQRGQIIAGVSTFEDISERKQAEEKIRQLNATLEQRVQERTAQLAEVNQELKRFTYTVSHDLRSPLRAIRGLIAALVEDYSDRFDELGQEYTQQISNSAHRMDQLIQDLLAYSQLSQTEIQLQVVDLTSVMQDILSQLRLEQQARQAEITVTFPLPPVISQPTVLTQVLINLLTNAMKYVPPGIHPQIRVWAEQRQNWIRLWVADNGIGIAPEYQKRIFGVFERLHAVDSYSGTGIGLAIVQKGIERLGGKVGVESQPGAGSQFWVELPAT
ncbi:PAS domain S-box protein [Anabaena sp. 4-3]|uniref:PAS domain-containing sensor histidine kinase n=1 Tax=Anabaena sp. 4-3 TaxID=1811979 RepID=UPI0008313FE3|nr:PAS domain S-box protein [Anabaena sp. 4-3]